MRQKKHHKSNHTFFHHKSFLILTTLFFCGMILLVGFSLILTKKKPSNTDTQDPGFYEKSPQNETSILNESSYLKFTDTESLSSFEESNDLNQVESFTETIENETELMEIKDYFYITEITDTIKQRITGISYPNTTTPLQIQYSDLAYLHVLYYDFQKQVQDGEIICNSLIAQDLLEIFEELYEHKYLIEKIKLVDEYGGDDEKSMADNNTSCFNYRVISGTDKISNHAYGLAIDINPYYNPYVFTNNGVTYIQPENSETYADRSLDFPHKITKQDYCYQLFTKHGFTWGGSWKNSKDYQHFEKKLEGIN